MSQRCGKEISTQKGIIRRIMPQLQWWHCWRGWTDDSGLLHNVLLHPETTAYASTICRRVSAPPGPCRLLVTGQAWRGERSVDGAKGKGKGESLANMLMGPEKAVSSGRESWGSELEWYDWLEGRLR